MEQNESQIKKCLLCGKQIAVINCNGCGGSYCASCAPLQRNIGCGFVQQDECNWELIEKRR